MALTPATTKREADPTGSDVRVFTDGSGALIQAVGLADESGAHAGIPTNPVVAELALDAGVVIEHGQGSRVDLASGSTATMWTGGDALYPFNATAETLQISSADNADTQTIVVEGTGAANVAVTQQQALTGQTPVTLGTDMVAVHRVYVLESETSAPAGAVYVSLDGAATTGGVPDSSSDVRAVISVGEGAARLGVYAIPAGYNGYLRHAAHSASAGAVEIYRRSTAGTIPRLLASLRGTGEASWGEPGIPSTGLGPFPAGSILETRFASEAAGADASVTFTLALVPTA